jgi:hypothetical protein
MTNQKRVGKNHTNTDEISVTIFWRQRMITVVSMSRRPDLYFEFVKSLEGSIPDLIDEYLVFVNDIVIIPRYYGFANNDCRKVKVVNAPEDFVFRYGHDTVYNYLEKKATSEYILKLFDTDVCDVNHDLLVEDLKSKADIYGMETYMERGNVWETKLQLYKRGVLAWFGLVHENQKFLSPNPPSVKSSKGLKVFHKNALDPESSTIEKNEDGFIILKKTKEGTDSDKRNLLYETLAWKIVNEGGRHDSLGWFQKHYKLNQEVIDWYYQRAKQKYEL